MPKFQDVAMKVGKQVVKCPVCGHPARIVMRDNRHADHYEAVTHRGGWKGEELAPVDFDTAVWLRKERKGKKTVALVGMSPTSCALAPYNEPSEKVEIWALNEMHALPWLKRWDRWFQIHESKSWHRPSVMKYGIDQIPHLDWLRTDHGHPVYMQYWNDEVPNVVAYPLHEICDVLLKNIKRGKKYIKYFTSTFAYMMGVALLEGRNPYKPEEKPFERIEVYGFEMTASEEFTEQKGCAEFWLGMAAGLGIEIYLPPNCVLLWSALYGGNEQGAGW